MNVAQLFFSFAGRINRAKYWLGILIFVFIGLLMGTVARVAEGVLAFELLSIVVHISLFIAGLGLGAKRLHDRDKSAWWLLLIYILPGVLFVIGSLMFFQSLGTDSAAGAIGGLGSVALALVLTIWAIVELGFLRGSAGANRFGPNPLATPP
jgi:uncharacterized membrane protein YhaH (DUF805 family)